MTTLPKPRIVVDFKANGDFFIYSDPEVEVICRSADAPDDKLYRYGHYPIPGEWLGGKPIGFLGDGSEADKKGRLIGAAFRTARGD